MSAKLACSVVPTIEICPNCKNEMTVIQVTPMFLAAGFEDVIYRCKGCHSDVKRMFKRGSGAWELVTLPSFLSPRPGKKKIATDANQSRAEKARVNIANG